MAARWFLFALLLAAVLSVAGDGRLVQNAEAQATPTKDVIVKGTAFNPPIVEVVKGTKVVWTNQDSGIMHTATNDPSGDKFDLTLFPNEFSASGLNKGSFTFNDLGVVKYHCNVHASMHGEIRVVATLTAAVVAIDAKDDNNNRRFDPNVASINATQKVNFTNRGQQPHNVNFEDTSVKGGDIPPGKSVVVEITKAGTFRFRCTFHSSDFTNGMIGELRVSAAPAGAKTPPTVTISTPNPGATVNGSVAVMGTVESAANQEEATSVEVRIGTGLAWQEAMMMEAGKWHYQWDTTTVADGPKTIYARAPSAGFADPTPVSIDVTVANGGDAGASPTPTTETKKGNTPGFELMPLFAGLLAAALCRRRS